MLAYSKIKIRRAFSIFAGVASVAWLYIYKLVPETLEMSSDRTKSEQHVVESQVSTETDVDLLAENMRVTKLYRSVTVPVYQRLISMKH